MAFSNKSDETTVGDIWQVPSDKISYADHLKRTSAPMSDMHKPVQTGGGTMLSGTLDPRKDTLHALGLIFETDRAIQIEEGLKDFVVRHLSVVECVKDMEWTSVRNSSLLELYTFKVCVFLKALEKYPDAVKIIKNIGIDDIKVSVQKNPFDLFESCAWSTEKDKSESFEKKMQYRKTTDVYKCKNCKKRKTLVREMQTRSADEPATLFIECANCQYTWHMSAA